MTVSDRIVRRLAARVVVGGRLYAPGASVHGTKATYDNWGCRCVPCSVDSREYQAARRRRVAA